MQKSEISQIKHVLKRENTILFLLVLFVFIVTYSTYGFYYGWIDDVIQMNIFRGTFNDAYNHDVYFHHSFLSYIYTCLYKRWTDFPWYGLFMYSYLFIAVFLFLKIIRVILTKNGISSIILFLLISGLLLATFLLESIVLLNYTKVAILLSGLSLIALLLLLSSNRNSRKIMFVKSFMVGITFILGFLTRPEVTGPVILLILLFLVFLPFYMPRIRKVQLFVFIMIVVSLFNIINRFVVHEPDDPVFKWEQYLINLTNGSNFNDEKLTRITKKNKDSIRYVAIRKFYFYDKQMFGIPFLERIGGSNFLANITLQQLYDKFQRELARAGSKYPNDFLSYYNYLWKVQLFLIINLSLLFMSLFCRINKIFLIQFIFFLFFIFLISSIAAFLKMQDRVFTPLIFIYTIINIIYTLRNYYQSNLSLKYKRLFFGALVLLFTVSATISISKLSVAASRLQTDIATKAKVIEEVKKNYKNKYIFLDILSMGLIHQKPLDPVDWSNYHLYTFGEYFSNFFSNYNQSFLNLCSSVKYDEFFHCLCKREDVLFLHSNMRINMLTSYFDILYDLPLSFRKVNHNSSLNQVNDLPIHAPAEFGYYKVNKNRSK